MAVFEREHCYFHSFPLPRSLDLPPHYHYPRRGVTANSDKVNWANESDEFRRSDAFRLDLLLLFGAKIDNNDA